jgi:hypothetical protein
MSDNTTLILYVVQVPIITPVVQAYSNTDLIIDWPLRVQEFSGVYSMGPHQVYSL